MHDLPHAVFRAHDHCCPQSYRADRLLSANLGRGLLHSHDVGKLRSHVPREGLSVTHLSIADLRCSVVKNSSNLLPSTHDRAQGLPRVTSCRLEYHFFMGSGLPFTSSPWARSNCAISSSTLFSAVT